MLAPPTLASSINIHGTFLDEGCIRFVDCAKNLGVWLDQHLNLKTHIQKVVSLCYMILTLFVEGGCDTIIRGGGGGGKFTPTLKSTVPLGPLLNPLAWTWTNTS